MKGEPSISVAPEELVSARDAARGFSGLVESLHRREQAKYVILHRNRMRAVLLTVEEYARLAAAAK